MCNVGTYDGRVCADARASGGASGCGGGGGGGAGGSKPGRKGRDGAHLLNFSVTHETPPDDAPPRRSHPAHGPRADSDYVVQRPTCR